MATIVVIGGSAGGIEALRAVVHSLRPGLDVAVFAVIHNHPESPGLLPRVLSNNGHYEARAAVDGEIISAGRIYVPPGDRHLLVERGAVRVTRGPQENRHRPAIDPLFRSAARAYGEDVIGVILSGSDADGSSGLAEIKARGGRAIVQDPESASFNVMPLAAIARVEVDWVLAAEEIGRLINRCAGLEETESIAMSRHRPRKSAEQQEEILRSGEIERSSPSAYSCPDCGGVLWEVREGDFVRFRCRVGHAFTQDGLLKAQASELERALWESLKTLEERVSLLRSIGRRMTERGRGAEFFFEKAETIEEHAGVLLNLLRHGNLFTDIEGSGPTPLEEGVPLE